MNNILVSIIVPCYKQDQYLDEALQSVISQSYLNWECIIVNDGSPDNTEIIAQEWLLKDNRFKYVYQENGGLSSARNTGIKEAKGEFILPLDSDDKIAFDYLEKAIETFKKDDSLKVVYCKAELFGAEGGLWNLKSFSIEDLAKENMIFCSAFFRKKDWELVGGYDIKMIYGWEDWEFWIAILKNGGNVACLNKVGFFYRTKPVSMVKNMGMEKVAYSHEYISIKHADFFVNQFGSFNALNFKQKETENNFRLKLKSRKFVIDLFCKTFLGFTIFKTLDNTSKE